MEYEKIPEIKIASIINTMKEFEWQCGKNTELALSSLIGEWKLEKVQTVFKEHRIYDYSSFDIKYTFRKDGILIISSDIEFIWGSTGEFPYHLLKNGSVLEINGMTFNSCLSGVKLRLDGSILDGPILCLTQINKL